MELQTFRPRITKEEKMEQQLDSLIPRHIGPNQKETDLMLKEVGYPSLDALSKTTIPENIQFHENLGIGQALSESQCISKLTSYAKKNKLHKNYIGMGYYPCKTPSVIQRNILENPCWYTQYTPYQAEISQGRLEALLNFQTMIIDLTGLEIANASLLDEGTAAAEAMSFSKSIKGLKRNSFFVSKDLHPQSIEILETRAQAVGIDLIIGDVTEDLFNTPDLFGAIFQYPFSNGDLVDYSDTIAKLKKNDVLVTLACDLLSLTMLKPPGELGADVAIGSSQRFGLGLFNGGPHAAFFATRSEYQRKVPGRIVGVTKDRDGNSALRLALQTREQHIRRDKATSNICTAQVLLAVAASMYAVYHGPNGLKAIAKRVHNLTKLLAYNLQQNAFSTNTHFFDTLSVTIENADKVYKLALQQKINLRKIDDKTIGISFDETCDYEDVVKLLALFGITNCQTLPNETQGIPKSLLRTSNYLQHPTFQSYHSETEFLRYVNRLQVKDLSLAQAMIPLGSCTMKLNATTEMLPISWPEFTDVHPFAPRDQMQGYELMFSELESDLEKITGFDAVSLQPNAGSQGEYAGLLAIKSFHETNQQAQRNICLIPTSAHGTNPASAVMAGFKVVPVKCDKNGNIDISDLQDKAQNNKDALGALMITYPSTHGVFESQIVEICNIIHEFGGQVYMDGANMNAQVGLCRPGDYGPDVCHLNLHKTFSIPHGGGGPGVGPIAVKKHLAKFLPGNKTFGLGEPEQMGAISAAPWGSALILTISWSYIKMMGDEGLKLSSQISILNANYIAKRLQNYYPVLYTDNNSLVAHECIIDTRPLKKQADVEVSDIAKRLMDYGFHAPTMSWPVIGTLMIEPTESESKTELDRFCEAMIAIYNEAQEIAEGKASKEDNLLKNAPHTAFRLAKTEWNHAYSREQAVFPTPDSYAFKFWPSVARVDDAHGDRNLICSCPGMEEYSEV